MTADAHHFWSRHENQPTLANHNNAALLELIIIARSCLLFYLFFLNLWSHSTVRLNTNPIFQIEI